MKDEQDTPQTRDETKTLVSEGAGFAPSNPRTGGPGVPAATPTMPTQTVTVRDRRRAVRLV